jgi:hypothetical protein
MADKNMDDYSGPFDPGFRYENLSKEALVKLLREWGIAVQLVTRAILTAVYLKYGPEAMEELAIEEWRGASPIYTERIRRALNIKDNDVPAILKSLQLDPGFVHQFHDTRYEVVDDKRGFFEVNHCGALVDVEPMGEENVIRVCHPVEDATFVATMRAVNPKASTRAVHRPPRKRADETPVCRWEVWIDEDAEPGGEAPITQITRKMSAAKFEFDP